MNPYRRLFLASFTTLVASGVGFSIRSGLLDDWGRQFGFTQTELGAITGSGLWVFGLAIMLFSVLADRIPYGRLMGAAFALHVLSAALTLSAGYVFAWFGKAAAFWLFYAGLSLFAVANGACEAVVNPLVTTLYPREKTHYLSVVHAGWPAGLILGGVLSYLMAERAGQVQVRWEIQYLIFLFPVLLYGGLMYRQNFPVSEVQAAGVPFTGMLKEFTRPVLLALLFLQAMVGYVELGTDSWIANLMTNIAGMKGILLLVYTSSIMFALRFFAGPIVHKISPLGLVFVSAVLATIGLFWLGSSTAAAAVFLAATIYGVGKTFFWPTMLGVVSELFPRGGAMTLGAVGAVGLFSAGLLGAPAIGYLQDYHATARLSQESPALLQRYAAPESWSFLFFPATQGLDGQRAGPLLEKPPAQLTESEQTVRAAVIYGGRMSLKWTALIPAMMAVGYFLLIVYFKVIGGYRQVHLEKRAGGESAPAPNA